MTFPSHRLRDPQPLSRGGEVAFVAVSLVLLLLGLAALTGLGTAAAVFGGGWVWPHGSDQIGHVLAGLLSGHPGAGLPPPEHARVPSQFLVHSCVTVAELLMLTVTVTAAVVFWRYHRPAGAGGGMATRAEAQQVLGASRLRHARPILRPDLIRRAGTRGATTHASDTGGVHDPSAPPSSITERTCG